MIRDLWAHGAAVCIAELEEVLLLEIPHICHGDGIIADIINTSDNMFILLTFTAWW